MSPVSPRSSVVAASGRVDIDGKAQQYNPGKLPSDLLDDFKNARMEKAEDGLRRRTGGVDNTVCIGGSLVRCVAGQSQIEPFLCIR